VQAVGQGLSVDGRERPQELGRLVGDMTTTLTQTFAAPTGQSFNIRMTLIDGEPWFAATDVCRALGLEMAAGSSHHLTSLRADERQKVHGPTLGLTEGGRGNPNINLISESGLYKLILRSDKASATPFQDWVTREVLPSIRKTGSYALPAGQDMPLPAEFLSVFREAIQAQTLLAERVAVAMEWGMASKRRGASMGCASASTRRRYGVLGGRAHRISLLTGTPNDSREFPQCLTVRHPRHSVPARCEHSR
jgi:prophage antirepressor-like protein